MTHYTQLQAGRLVDENLRLRRELAEWKQLAVQVFTEGDGEIDPGVEGVVGTALCDKFKEMMKP